MILNSYLKVYTYCADRKYWNNHPDMQPVILQMPTGCMLLWWFVHIRFFLIQKISHNFPPKKLFLLNPLHSFKTISKLMDISSLCVKGIFHSSFTPVHFFLKMISLEKYWLVANRNAYGCEFFCVRLRISSATVTNFFLHGYGDARNRTGIKFRTVTVKPVTVPVWVL